MAFTASYVILARDRFSKQIKNINTRLRLLKRRSKDIKRAFQELRAPALVATAAITAGFGGSIIAASKFQQEISNVFTLLDQDTLDEFGGDLKKASMQALKMGFSIQDSNKALFDTVSAIGDVEKSIGIYQQAQKLAIGGVTDLSIAVDGITSIMNAYGKEVTDAKDVSNAFFSSQRAGKTTVAALAVNVGKVAPVAKQAGVGYKELLATMSQLTLAGLSTEEASTALRSAMSGLLAPSKEAIKIFKKAKIPVGAAALQSANWADVLAKIPSVLEKNKDALSDMFPNIRAMTAAGSLGAKEIENLRKIVVKTNEDIKNGTGLTDAYNLQMENISRQFKIFKGTLTVVAIKFGTLLFPAIKKVLKVGIKLLTFFELLSPASKTVILVLGAIVGVISGITLAVAIILPLLATLKFTLVTLGITAGTTWGAILGPITLIILGIAAVTAAIILLIEKWDIFKKALLNIVDLFNKLFPRAAALFKMIEKIAGVLGIIKGANLAAKGFQLPQLATVGAGVQSSLDANINMNVNAPKGAVQSIVSKTKSNNSNVNLGINMEESL
jgi:TP901 family phage tail tape measure protein